MHRQPPAFLQKAAAQSEPGTMDPAGGSGGERQHERHERLERQSRREDDSAPQTQDRRSLARLGDNNRNNNDSKDTTDASRTVDLADMEIARRFLADEKVQNASKSQKIRFLRAKGLREDQIEILLRESEIRTESKAQSQDAVVERSRPDDDEPPRHLQQQSQQPQHQPQQQQQQYSQQLERRERAPIVTYPEFLARAKEPKPLITPDTILNSLYALAGVSAVVYGANALVVEPMVESLHDARHELFATTSRNLDELIRKLESVVSVVPPPTASSNSRQRSGTQTTAATSDDSVSDYNYYYDDDTIPTELFSRDIGTQTSPASTLRRERSPFNTAYEPKDGDIAGSRFHTDRLPDEPVHNLHARWVGRLAASASLLRVDLDGQTESMADTKATIDSFTTDLEKMASQSKKYGLPGNGAASFTPGRTNVFYGVVDALRKPEEPDDEIKRMKESIRKYKGALLGARAFARKVSTRGPPVGGPPGGPMPGGPPNINGGPPGPPPSNPPSVMGDAPPNPRMFGGPPSMMGGPSINGGPPGPPPSNPPSVMGDAPPNPRMLGGPPPMAGSLGTIPGGPPPLMGGSLGAWSDAGSRPPTANPGSRPPSANPELRSS